MKSLYGTLLLTVVGSFLLVSGYQGIRHPSPDLWRFTPYFKILLAVLLFFGVFDARRRIKRGEPLIEPEQAPKRLTRLERIGFRVMGVTAVAIGLVALGAGGWSTWEQWIRIARWPRADAVVVWNEISNVSMRLVFQYEAGGQRFGAGEFRWVWQKSVRNEFESYQPGTIHEISYDPDNPEDVESFLSHKWELFRVPVFGMIFGWLLIVWGIVVYRDSL